MTTNDKSDWNDGPKSSDDIRKYIAKDLPAKDVTLAGFHMKGKWSDKNRLDGLNIWELGRSVKKNRLQRRLQDSPPYTFERQPGREMDRL